MITRKPHCCIATNVVLLSVLFPIWPLHAQTTVSIGTGSGTTTEYPVRSASVASYSQQIFLQSEIGQAGNIIGIRFFAQSGGGLTNSNNWTVWLNTTTEVEFTSATASGWKAAGTQRFNGNVTWPGDGEWLQVNIAAHAYNNVAGQHLLLTVRENANNASDPGHVWGGYNAGPNRGMRGVASTQPFLPGSQGGSRQGTINRIELVFDSPCIAQSANAGAAPASICQGGTSSPLGGSVGGSATTGQWTSPQGGTFSPNANALDATYTPPAGFSGTATLTLTSTNGCNAPAESSTEIAVLPSSAGNDAQTICEGESIAIDGNTYTTAGTYVHVLEAANGCDSVVTTVLSVLDPDLDTSVAIAGITLTANETEATYQWVDCDNGFAAISGASSQSFTPGANGIYAVLLRSLECPMITAESACQEITTVGMREQDGQSHITIHPNPAQDFLYIGALSGSMAQAVVLDASGKVVGTQSMFAGSAVLDVRHLESGSYILRWDGAQAPLYGRFVKQ